MTITIDIHLHPEHGPVDKQLDDHLAALGYVRQKPGYSMTRVLTGNAEIDHQTMVETESDNPSQLADDLASAGIAHTLDVTPKRERGKPSPGHARRTKAEIAEDEAAAAASTVETSDEADPAGRIEAATAPTVEDTPEVQASDAADEAAETAANKPADAPPTVEDIRNVLGLYQKIYGIAACMEDGPAILQEVCGEGVVKVSSVPEDKIAAVVAALKKAGNENRFGRTAVTS